MRPRLFLFLVVFITACVPVSSTSMQRAAVVVSEPGGSLFSACITFNEPELSGVELLERSGVPLVLDAGNSAGVLVCSLNDVGCQFPLEDCFCQCSGGGTCTYWAYFNLSDEGGWVYAPLGASGRKVSDGAVDLWAWIDSGGVGDFDAGVLPTLTFEEICQ